MSNWQSGVWRACPLQRPQPLPEPLLSLASPFGTPNHRPSAPFPLLPTFPTPCSIALLAVHRHQAAVAAQRGGHPRAQPGLPHRLRHAPRAAAGLGRGGCLGHPAQGGCPARASMQMQLHHLEEHGYLTSGAACARGGWVPRGGSICAWWKLRKPRSWAASQRPCSLATCTSSATAAVPRPRPNACCARCPAALRCMQVVASSLDSLQPVLLEGFACDQDLAACLRASACVPEIAGGPVQHRCVAGAAALVCCTAGWLAAFCSSGAVPSVCQPPASHPPTSTTFTTTT